jgi:fibronectin-binding autotransporter adhesin
MNLTMKRATIMTMQKDIGTAQLFVHHSRSLSSACLCLLSALVAGQTARAQSQYFTSAVANDGTYSWDAANWNAPGSTGNTSPYSSTWMSGEFARFYNGSGDDYTVTVNASESMIGMYLNAGSSVDLSIDDAGNNTGSLNIVPNGTLQNGFGYTQGFLTGGGILTLNAPIAGTGGIEEESGGGHLQLFGDNTYSGGTLFTSSSTFVDYNNNNSFGSGSIGFYNTTFSLMESQGTSLITLANPVQILGGTTGVDFIGSAPVTSSGTWTMGAFNVNLRNNGNSTAPVTISGAISGTGTLTLSGANGGNIIFSAANSFSGPIVVGSAGDTSITLTLGAANTIANSSSLTLAGGTVNLGGLNQIMSSTPLGLTASSTIDFTPAGSAAFFANSSSQAWSGTLNLINWNPSVDILNFGLSGSGLTAGQLDDIEFNGAGLGDAVINPAGFVSEVPEPPTVLLGVVGSLAMMWRARRRSA